MINYSISKFYTKSGDIEKYNELPVTVWDRAHTYVQKADRLRHLHTRWILKNMLEHQYDTHFEPANFSYTRTGMPQYAGFKGVSIAHSGDYGMVALSVDQRVGCDVQKRTDVSPDGYRDLFNPKQWKQVSSSEMFFRYWVIKEAFSKALGLGMQLDFSEIDIDFDGFKVTYLGGEWRFMELRNIPGYCAALVGKTLISVKNA